MGVTAESVKQWLVDNAGLESGDVEGDTLLFSTSLVDSFDLIDLVTWIEETAGFTFGPLDINLDNLDTVERIVAFVQSKAG